MFFGERLKQLRKEKGWSQDKLGEMVKIHGRHIGKYELGQVLPTAEAIVRIATAFGVSTDYLLRDDNISEEILPNIKDKRLLKEFEEVEKMSDQDRETIISLIDAYIKKNQITGILAQH
ncbi:MAG: helix-turn-helix transcriptional regulator [Brevinematales bacterium]